MSGVINWLQGNTIFILTCALSGDPDYHPESIKTMAPLQQWVFRNPHEAVDAAETITSAINVRLVENEESELAQPEIWKELVEQSQDIIFAAQLKDVEGHLLYNLYITAFKKDGRKWI